MDPHPIPQPRGGLARRTLEDVARAHGLGAPIVDDALAAMLADGLAYPRTRARWSAWLGVYWPRVMASHRQGGGHSDEAAGTGALVPHVAPDRPPAPAPDMAAAAARIVDAVLAALAEYEAGRREALERAAAAAVAALEDAAPAPAAPPMADLNGHVVPYPLQRVAVSADVADRRRPGAGKV